MTEELFVQLLSYDNMKEYMSSINLKNFETIEGYSSYLLSINTSALKAKFSNILFIAKGEISYRSKPDIYDIEYLEYSYLNENELSFIDGIGVDFSDAEQLEERLYGDNQHRKKKGDNEKYYWKALKHLNHKEIQLLAIEFSSLLFCLHKVYEKLENTLRILKPRLKTVEKKCGNNRKDSELQSIKEALQGIKKTVEKQQQLIFSKINLLSDCLKILNIIDSEETRSTFINRFAELMDDNETERNEIVSWLGIANSTFSDYKTGRILPGILNLRALSTLFDVDIAYLVGGTDIKRKQMQNAYNILSALGLNDKAVNNLYSLYKTDHEGYSKIIKCLNLLLCDNNFKSLISIYNYLATDTNEHELSITATDIKGYFGSMLHKMETRPDYDWSMITSDLQEFLNNIPANEHRELERTLISNIQENLTNLKTDSWSKDELGNRPIEDVFEAGNFGNIATTDTIPPFCKNCEHLQEDNKVDI